MMAMMYTCLAKQDQYQISVPPHLKGVLARRAGINIYCNPKAVLK